jgi:hypothetical protein
MKTWQSTDIPISVKNIITAKMVKMYVFAVVNIDFVMFKTVRQVAGC